MKYLNYAVKGLAVLIGLVWFGAEMKWGRDVAQYQRAVANGELTPEQDREAFARIMEGPAPLEWWRTRGDLRAHFRLDELTDERTVQFSQRIAIESLLAPNEAPPHRALYQAYAAARAPGYFVANCAELLDTIASTCKVYHSEGEGPNRHYDSAGISSSLTYIPSYPLGDPTTVENGKMRTSYIGIDKDPDLLDGDSRRAVYLRARDICAQVRSVLGNCVIENVRFDDGFLRLSGRAAGVRPQTASVSITVFLDRTIYDRDDLDPIVEDIAAVLAAETG